MEDLDSFDRLVGQIYDVPLAPDSLPRVLEQLTHRLDGDGCHLVGWSGGAPVPFLSVVVGIEAERHFPFHAARLPPGSRRPSFLAQHKRQERVANEVDFAQEQQTSHSEPESNEALDDDYELSTTLIDDAQHFVRVAFRRLPSGRQPFGARETSFLSRLTPHLQRATALLLGANTLRQETDVVAAGGDAAPFAVIALDHEDRPIICNRQANSLLRQQSVLQRRNGTLSAVVPKQQLALTAALRAAAASGEPRSLILSSQPELGPPVRLSLTALPAPEPGSYGLPSRAYVLCLIAPLGLRRLATAAQLMQLFGLTPAEARLLRALGRGETLEDYSRDCDLRLSTVKTQLNSVFSKTGTHRQVDLVRLLLDIPVIRTPATASHR